MTVVTITATIAPERCMRCGIEHPPATATDEHGRTVCAYTEACKNRLQDLRVIVICDNADTCERAGEIINAIYGIPWNKAEDVVEQWNTTSTHADRCAACGQVGMASLHDRDAGGLPVFIPVVCVTSQCDFSGATYHYEPVYEIDNLAKFPDEKKHEFIADWYNAGGVACAGCDVLGAPFGDPFGNEEWPL